MPYVVIMLRDLIHGVTKGKSDYCKIYLLALQVRNLTATSKVIDINNRLGHCISYNRTCDIETALASFVNQRTESPLISSIEQTLEDQSDLSTKYFLWVWLSYQNQFHQTSPNFPRWLLQRLQKLLEILEIIQ